MGSTITRFHCTRIFSLNEDHHSSRIYACCLSNLVQYRWWTRTSLSRWSRLDPNYVTFYLAQQDSSEDDSTHLISMCGTMNDYLLRLIQMLIDESQGQAKWTGSKRNAIILSFLIQYCTTAVSVPSCPHAFCLSLCKCQCLRVKYIAQPLCIWTDNALQLCFVVMRASWSIEWDCGVTTLC